MNGDDERDYAEEAENARIDRDEHDHSWVAGMMVVPVEDLGAVAEGRGAQGIVCTWCDITYADALALGYDPYEPAWPAEYRHGGTGEANA